MISPITVTQKITLTIGKSNKFAIKDIRENPPKYLIDNGIATNCDAIKTDNVEEVFCGKKAKTLFIGGAKTMREKQIEKDKIYPIENKSFGF